MPEDLSQSQPAKEAQWRIWEIVRKWISLLCVEQRYHRRDISISNPQEKVTTGQETYHYTAPVRDTNPLNRITEPGVCFILVLTKRKESSVGHTDGRQITSFSALCIDSRQRFVLASQCTLKVDPRHAKHLSAMLIQCQLVFLES
jgi:hypothetical protein